MTTVTSTTAAGETGGDPRRWRALGFMLLAGSMNLVDVTIVTVATPTIRADFGAAAGPIGLVVAIYALVFGLGLITGGRLGDVYGRRRVFVAGIAGFTAASALCGLAPNLEVLVAARALQAAFAAVMVPQVIATIQVMFTGEERAKALGIWGAALGLSTVGAPLLGAALVEGDILGLDWRPIFLVNLPLGVVALLGALAYVPESRSERPLRLDLAGVALLSVGLGLFGYPLAQGERLGWPAWTFVAMACAVPVLLGFALYERRVGDRGSPLVPPRLFRQPGFTGGLLFGLAFASGIVGFSLVLQLTLQDGLDFSPARAALTVLPFSVGIVLASGVGMSLAPRLGRRLILAGVVLLMAGLVAIAVALRSAGGDVGALDLLAGMSLCGLGMGAVFPTLVGVALAEVDPDDAGSATGVIHSAMEIGSGVGVAVMGAIFFALLPAGVAPGEAYTAALADAIWFNLLLFVVSAALVALLPRRPPRPDGGLAPVEPAATPAPAVRPGATPEEIAG